MREAANYLERTHSARQHLRTEEYRALLENPTTRKWALQDESSEILAAAELYATYRAKLLEARLSLQAFRDGYHDFFDQRKANMSPTEIDILFEKNVRLRAEDIRREEDNFVIARKRALLAGADMLSVPSGMRDGPITEPLYTIPGDGEASSMPRAV